MIISVKKGGRLVINVTQYVDPPVALPATDVDLYRFRANWTWDASPSGYRIDVAYDGSFNSLVPGYANLNVGDVSSWPVIGLNSSTNYYYRLRAVIGSATSANSNVIDLSTLTLPAPIALPATDISILYFRSNWTDVSGAIGYYLDVDDTSNFSSPLPAYNNLNVGNVSTYGISGLSSDVSYYYRLRAYDNARNSANSNIINVSTNITTYRACLTFQPHFATVSPSSGFLNVDVMDSSYGTLGDYVIEWRLNSSNGTVVFVSGEGSDPSIQAQHPVTNEVVFSGTLYPVIKYAYIDGSKYSVYYDRSWRYSPDLVTCLNPITVTAIDCCTKLGADYVYPYFLQYVNTADYGANKSRTLKYDICPSIGYLAWDLAAYSVPEKLKITYCTSTNSTGILLDNFVVGSLITTASENLYPVNYPTNSRVRSASSIKFITNLIANVSYNSGDYLKIEITGSVYDPSNSNTNWDIKLKSLPYDISSGWTADARLSQINLVANPSMFYNTVNCRYDLQYDTCINSQNFTYGKNSTAFNQINAYPPLYVYTDLGFYTLNNNAATNPWQNVQETLLWSTSYSTGSKTAPYPPNYYTCLNLSAGQSITMQFQTADVSAWVFTFTDVSDYNVFMYDVSLIQHDVQYTKALAAPDTSIEHFAYYLITFNNASTCGDVGIEYNLYYHLLSEVSADPAAKTIKFISYIPTNNIVDVSCDTRHSSATGLISTFNTTKNATNIASPTLPKVSNVRRHGPVAAFFPNPYYTFDTTRETAQFFFIHPVMLNNIFDVSALGFKYDISTGGGYDYYTRGVWTLHKYWDRFSFTGETTDNSTRLNHWRLERKKFLRTNNPADASIGFEIIYDISIA